MPEIILVEDDSDDIYFFEIACKAINMDIKLTVLKNGLELTNYVKTNDMHGKIFLIDLNMPKLGGIEALSLLRNSIDFHHMIAIIYTTSSREKDIEDAYSIGAKSYLLKPDSVTKIKELIKTTVNYWFDNNIQLVMKEA